MVPLCSAGRTVYRGRKPPQRFQPQHDRPWRASDKPARAATIFTHNGAPKALVGCLGTGASSVFILDARAQPCATSAATTASRSGRKLNLLGGLFTDWLFEVTAELEAHRGEELILVVRFAA